MGESMKGSLGARALLVLTLLALVALGAAGGSARAATGACDAKAGVPPRANHFGGVIGAVPVDLGCVNTDNAAVGDPPLIWHNGPVMGTSTTGPVVVTPIFWHPAGHPMDPAYQGLISRYLADVARDSGRRTNVFSTLTEYFGTNGYINYELRAGTPIDDTNPLPANGCTLDNKDRAGIYADGSGYDACLDDDQVQAETAGVVKANKLTVNLSHIYVLFLPKHVETCFLPGSTSSLKQGNQACTINHEKSAGYCAYHTMAPNRMVYANLSYPIYHSPLQTVAYTCGSDAHSAFGVLQTPNGNADADTEISPTSHEIMEAITDPDVSTGWYDAIGYENGDECAYVYGTPQGTAGQYYNQVINHNRYLTQEEFSNNDFLNTGLGCLQST
jgi:hypothetical protein